MIEVASLVVAIISAFTGANSVFQSWRANRDAKKALSQSLEIGPPHVRDEYNRHLDRLGDRFARGDHIGCSALSEIVIILQHQLLQNIYSLMSGPASESTLSYLCTVSDNARIDATKALLEQYQRLAIAAPVATPLRVDGFKCNVCCYIVHDRTSFKCLDCSDYAMCPDCLNGRRAEHPLQHRFHQVNMACLPSTHSASAPPKNKKPKAVGGGRHPVRASGTSRVSRIRAIEASFES